MQFLVLRTYPEVCGGNQHGDPGLQSISLHLVFEKISSTLDINQVNFLVTLF